MNQSQWHRDSELTVQDDHLLTVVQAAAFLQVSPRWLRTKAARGEIPCHRLSRQTIRFDREELRQWRRERP